jgi:hypothetical protein
MRFSLMHLNSCSMLFICADRLLAGEVQVKQRSDDCSADSFETEFVRAGTKFPRVDVAMPKSGAFFTVDRCAYVNASIKYAKARDAH